MIQEREERVAEPTQHDALRMGVTDAAPAQPGQIGAHVRLHELLRDDDAERDGNEQRDECRDDVRPNERVVHDRAATGGDGTGHGQPAINTV